MGHHYGYVSEQLITGGLFPPRRRNGAGHRAVASAPPAGLPRQRAVASTWRRCAPTSTSRRRGRVVTNNAATTQTPRELLDLYRSSSPWYESVHRGQSDGVAAR